jgi:hypothetical protein
MNKILLYFIKLIHFLFVCFVIIVPFTNLKPLLLIHCLFVPFMLIHWGFNNDSCSLTVLEEKLTKKIYGENNYKENECITCKIIKPIYNYINDKDKFTGLIWILALLLCLFAFFKIYYLIYFNIIRHPLEMFIL